MYNSYIIDTLWYYPYSMYVNIYLFYDFLSQEGLLLSFSCTFMAYILWWHGHSSELIFISQKLFQILWWLHIISFIFFKDFAGKSKFIFNMDFFFWKIIVYFDDMVCGRQSLLPHWQLVKTHNISQKSNVQIKNEFALPSKIFWKNEWNNMWSVTIKF